MSNKVLEMGNTNALSAGSLESILSLEGKAAIVTGGTTGLGYAIANRLAGAGAKVVIVGRSEDKGSRAATEFQERGLEVSFCKADITCVEACDEVVKFTEDTYGKVDILVNNAACWHFSALVDQTEANYDKVMDLNVKGTYFMSRAAARSMITHRSAGKIVNIASVGYIAQDSNHIALLTTYNASKGAVVSLTIGMAKELRQYGINVNCVAPGAMDTYGNMQPNEGLVGYYQKYGQEFAALQREGSKDLPYCHPDEVARVVYMFCTDMANFIYGETIKVSGGSHLSYQKLPLSLTLDIPEDYTPPRPIYTTSTFPFSGVDLEAVRNGKKES